MGTVMDACGVILAGGASRRMGTCKALLEFDGEPLIQRVTRRLTAWFAQVVVVTNSPEAYQFLAVPLLPDRVAGMGPLAGLEAGLLASRYPHTFLCATDMPFVHEGLVRHLVGLAPEHDIVVPCIDGMYEPMHAVYSRSCLPLVGSLLDQQRLSLLDIFSGARMRAVPDDEVLAFGDPERLFFNCNTPDDLNRARAWLDDHPGS